ncbi:MAG: ABC transporter ATP-binding protein [Acetobacteraceae bacterium]
MIQAAAISATVQAAAVPALEIVDLSKRFGGVLATRGVSLRVMPGERRLLIGPNGAGKTTLFNLITGDLRGDGGSIRLFGQELLGLPTRRRVQLGLARTYQILTLFPHETLAHNVALALIGGTSVGWLPWGAFARRRALHEAAVAALERVGLAGLADCRTSETAYGERRRLELAMALAQRPRLLLLDEPLAGLSAPERETVSAVLDRLPADITIVLIEHDMDMALAFAERITLLNFGAVVLEGTRAEVIADPRTREVYLGE